MRNKLLLFFIFSLFTGNVLAQNEHVNSKKYTILLSGASFASPENGWFELGCRFSSLRNQNQKQLIVQLAEKL